MSERDHAAPTRVHRLVALTLAALVALGLAVTVAPAADASYSAARVRASKVHHTEQIVLNQLGDWYAYGAAGPNAFDCSGLMYYAAHRAGFRHMPRTSSAQSHYTRHIAKSRMRPGDFMFFYGGGSVYHVAMFLGWRHGRAWMVDAPEPGQRVHRHYTWTSAWFGGTLR